MELKLKDFKDAQKRIECLVRHTPLDHSKTLSKITGGEIYLKCENLQTTGSFKIRGATNRISILAKEGKCKKVVAASAGNHAQGVACAATKFNIKSTIIMPLGTPIAKIQATKGYGAKILEIGECFDDAYEHAVNYAKKEGATFVHPYDDKDVIVGQGTVGLEILEDLKDAEMVLIPAGGGGLLAGVSTALKLINPKIQVVGVQSENANAICLSYKNKKKIVTSSSRTIAEGISVKNPGNNTLPLIYKNVDQMITVNDEEIANAILFLMERNKIIVEGAGATPVAAVLHNKINVKNKKVVLLISGGNIDFTFINRLLERGLYSYNRRIQLFVVLPNDKKSTESFMNLLREEGVNIIDMKIDTASTYASINEIMMNLVCEISDKNHKLQLIERFKKSGYKIKFEKPTGDTYIYIKK